MKLLFIYNIKIKKKILILDIIWFIRYKRIKLNYRDIKGVIIEDYKEFIKDNKIVKGYIIYFVYEWDSGSINVKKCLVYKYGFA